jgi:hypothetical protein
VRSPPHYSVETLAEFRMMQSWYVIAALFLISEAPLAAFLSFHASIAPMIICLIGAVYTQVIARRHFHKFQSLARADRDSETQNE